MVDAVTVRGHPDLVPPEFALIGQLLGPVIGAAIAYFVMRLNQQQQAKLEDVKDARALRDARRARLASAYEIALIAVVAMNHFVSVQHLAQAKDEQLEAVFLNIDQALARLVLEPGAQPIAQQFEQLIRGFTALRVMEGQQMDPQVRLTDLQRRRDEFQQKINAFQYAIHASLEPLDQPISAAQQRLPSP